MNQEWFVTIAGVVIMVFGAHFLGVFRIGFMDREMRMDAGDRGGSAFGAYVLGLAFAFGWTPCIGPILGAILSIAANEADVARGTTLAGGLCCGPWHPVPAGRGLLPAAQGDDGVDEAAHGADRADHGALAVDRGPPDADGQVHRLSPGG
jgi:cytochrome c-type biogenesis protein